MALDVTADGSSCQTPTSMMAYVMCGRQTTHKYML